MSINKLLISRYHQHWCEFRSKLNALNSDKHTNPFLLSFDEEKLKSSDLRVMIFGQETKGWGDQFGVINNPDDVISMYHHFFCKKNFYSGYGRSSFWKAFRYFEKQLVASYPDKKIYFSWNNISKVGKSMGKTGVSSEVREIEQESFSVINYEVDVFKPHIVIFLTGPDRDRDIKHHFIDAEFVKVNTNIKKRALALVKSKELPNQTIRMYHPSYFGGFNKVKKYAVEQLATLSGITAAN